MMSVSIKKYLLIVGLFIATASHAAAPVLSIQSAATTYTTVFNFSDPNAPNFVRCNASCAPISPAPCTIGGHDFPDNPPRPFPGPDGNMWLWASNSEAPSINIAEPSYGSYIKEANADLSGPAAVVSQCQIGFQYTPVNATDGPPSTVMASLASLNNQHWLMEFWAQGVGRNFQATAMIQNDFRFDNLMDCPAPYNNLSDCRYTNLVSGAWSNQQYQFTVPYTPVTNDGVVDDYITSPVFVTPYQYKPTYGAQGVNAQTNILYVKNLGDRIPYYYMMVNEALPAATPGPDTPAGVCLFRTNNVNDPNSWLGWNAATKTFSIPFNVNPYTTTINNPQSCSFVLPTSYRFSLAYDPQYRTFIAIGDVASTMSPVSAVVYATTQDLTNWGPPDAPTNTGTILTNTSTPSFVSEQYWLASNTCPGVPPNITGEGYLSLIDPTSSSISRAYFGQADSNFQYVGGNPYLYLVRFNPITVCNYGSDTLRDVVRLPLTITCTANCS